MFKNFYEWLKQQNWQITLNEENKVKLNKEFTNRYPNINNEYMEFLKYFVEIVSEDEKTWFICSSEYNNISESAFRWNEFEELSLEAAEDDNEWKEEIRQWWDKKLPIIMSLRDGYSFFAIDLEENCGNVVRGEEPEFEEAEVVANDFFEFIDKVINGEIIIK